MNIDEFLDSNKTTATVNDIDIIKINYNEKIDFIYKPEYKKIQYGYDLKFLGLFEKASKKLYGSYFIFQSDYYKDLYSRYFVSNIEDIEKNLINDANVCLNAYIKENQLQLMNIGKNIFNEYISDESNYEKIKDKAIHDYIYNLNNSELKFSIELNKNNIDIKELIIQYVESPIKTVKKVLDNYINNPDKYDRIYYNNK